MKIKYTEKDGNFVILITPKDDNEKKEIEKRLQFAELCSEQSKKEEGEKDRWSLEYGEQKMEKKYK